MKVIIVDTASDMASIKKCASIRFSFFSNSFNILYDFEYIIIYLLNYSDLLPVIEPEPDLEPDQTIVQDLNLDTEPDQTSEPDPDLDHALSQDLDNALYQALVPDKYRWQ
jgi:hypothetical protein